MVTNALIARHRNYPVEAPVPLSDLPRVTLDAFPALLLPVILLVGIYGGIMTPTEGAAAAAAYALLAAALIYRALSMKQLYGVLLSSAKSTTSVGMLIAGALAFNYVVTAENIPVGVQHFVEGLHLSKLGFLVIVNIILLVLGCLLEGTTILLIIVPIFIPSVRALGIDTVHFGVVVVVNIMIGLLTPPFGLLLFIVANMTRQPLLDIVRESIPFILAAILMLAVITFIPETVLWLPRIMGYKH
jgi:tripartite ATP-independent transporter DctM subunit